MEFIITAAIIIVLLLILGVSPTSMMIVIVWLMEAALVGMTLFFLVSVLLILFGKSKRAHFVRFTEARFPAAVYEIEENEYTNLFPAENHLRKVIYKDNEQKVKLLKAGKLYFLYDRHSILISALGFPVSILSAAGLGWLLLFAV